MRADLHIHTSFSYSGLPTPKEVVDFALSKNLGCIAICDHQEIKGALQAMEYAKSRPIIVIPGIEIKSKEGEILALNVKEKVGSGLSAKETIETIVKKGGLAVIPHPFDYFQPFWGLEKMVDFLKEKKVAIEIFNASMLFFAPNIQAKDFVEKFNLPFTAGSDAHSLNFIGKGYLELKEMKSSKEVIEAIIRKEVHFGFEPISFWEKLGDQLKRLMVKIKG